MIHTYSAGSEGESTGIQGETQAVGGEGGVQLHCNNCGRRKKGEVRLPRHAPPPAAHCRRSSITAG